MDDPATVGELIDTRLRVVTWNLWWRFGDQWEARLERIVEVLRAAAPDVVALQEVWHDGETSSARHIADALGATAVEAPGIDLGDGLLLGNAVVARWPVAGHEVRALPAGDAPDEQRRVVRADVDGPRGPLQVFCTHLNWRADHSAVRQQQVRAVAELVVDSRPRTYPPIVCGDFNAEPQSAEVEMLTGQREVAVDGLVLADAWRALHPTDPGFTWDNRNPSAASQLEWNRRIDYVFVGWPKARGAGVPVHAELVGTEPIDGVWPSDHFGVLCDLRY